MRGSSVDAASTNADGKDQSSTTGTIFDNIKKNNQLQSIHKIQVAPVGVKASKRDLSVKASQKFNNLSISSEWQNPDPLRTRSLHEADGGAKPPRAQWDSSSLSPQHKTIEQIMNLRKPTNSLDQASPSGNEMYTSEPIAADAKINLAGLLKIEEKFI